MTDCRYCWRTLWHDVSICRDEYRVELQAWEDQENNALPSEFGEDGDSPQEQEW